MNIGGNRWLPAEEPPGPASLSEMSLKALKAITSILLVNSLKETILGLQVNCKCVIWEGRNSGCSKGALAPGGSVAKRERGVAGRGWKGAGVTLPS